MSNTEMLLKYDKLLKSLANRNKVYGYDSEDILQELRMIAIQCMPRYNAEKGNFKAYLIKSCYYKIADLRKKNRRNNFDSLDAPIGDGTTFLDIVVDPSVDIEQDFVNDETLVEILETLENVENGMTALEYILGDKTQQEIANELGITQSAVTKRIKKALEAAKEALDV